MQKVINHLVQLQELIQVREEQRLAARVDRLEALDAAITKLSEELPAEIRTLFERLMKRDRIAIAPISEGICAVCGMKLPISLVQAVRLVRQIQSCPACAHILYDPNDAPRHVGRQARRSDPRKVGIARFSSDTLMVPQLQAKDKEAAIAELAKKMEEAEFVDDALKLTEAVMRRESVAGTGLKHGLAVPHARGVEGGGLTMALGISKQGIAFGNGDEELSKIIFLMVIPTAASSFYLKLLAGLAEAFSQAEARKALLAEKEPEKLWKALVKVTRSTIK
jgi:mannitol/fructose-specific phosphotransferase system IIA component (Ntr-type)